MTNHQIRVVCWNLDHDGVFNLDASAWEEAMGILAGLRPDVILRQELNDSLRRGRARLFTAERRLGMRGFLAEADPEAPVHTAVFVRPELGQVIAHHQHRRAFWLPVSQVSVQLPEVGTVPLHVASFHLCWFSPRQREIEAAYLTTLGQPGMHTILGGDTNSLPATSAPTHLGGADPAHIAHRAWPSTEDEPLADVTPDLVLSRPFVDAAAQFADPRAHQATAGWRRPDQGEGQRIDRIYLSRPLDPALSGFEVLDDARLRRLSDHLPVLATLERDLLVDILQEANTDIVTVEA